MRILSCLLLFIAGYSQAQTSYRDSLISFREKYVQEHEVVKGADRSFLAFFPIKKEYCVVAQFEPASKSQWFKMESSGPVKKFYRTYGKISFRLHDSLYQLSIYQSQNLIQSAEYHDYLLLPFTDATTGISSYESGRYIDLTIKDIKNNTVIIDFNKAYNPYCAYTNGYNCPIPPPENNLTVAIEAGEKKFGKEH